MPEQCSKSQYRFLDYRLEGPVATITLTQPDIGNRIEPALAAELREVCRVIGETDTVRCVVITGSGGVFSVGREAQLENFPPGGPETGQEWLREHQVASCLAGLPMPVIAAVNGNALDHGLELALAADLRIAVRNAQFGLTDLAGGLFPWDGGPQRLTRLVGPGWARDMIFTGRIIDAAQALDLGLVNSVVDADKLEAQARQLADSIAAGAPLAARYAKEAVQAGMDLSLSQGLRLEADLNILLHNTADRAQGIKSFLDRSRPEFRGS